MCVYCFMLLADAVLFSMGLLAVDFNFFGGLNAVSGLLGGHRVTHLLSLTTEEML